MVCSGWGWIGMKVIQSERVIRRRHPFPAGLAYRCYASEEELESMRNGQKQRIKPRATTTATAISRPSRPFQAEAGSRGAVPIDDDALIRWTDLVRGAMSWRGSDLGGDMVIARRAPANQIGDPLYNLVVVVDDAAMAITHVIRGEDHIANTVAVTALRRSTYPCRVRAAPLILNAGGRKLSKRDGVTSIGDFRSMGYTAEAIANYMTLWLVGSGMEERFSLSEAAAVFDFDRVNKAGARFDWDKLNWLIARCCMPAQQSNCWTTSHHDGQLRAGRFRMIRRASISARCWDHPHLDQDGVDQARPFFELPAMEEDGEKQMSSEGAAEAIRVLHQMLQNDRWDGTDIEQGRPPLAKPPRRLASRRGADEITARRFAGATARS